MEARKIAPTKLANLHPKSDLVTITGIITSVRTQISERGKRMFITLDDKSARLELMIFAEEAERYGRFIKEEQLVFMQVSVQPDRYAGGDNLRINCKRVMDLIHARVSNAHTLLIDLDLRINALDVTALKNCLKQNLDNEGLSVAIRAQIQGARAEIKLGMDWQVIPTDELVAQLKQMPAVRKVTWA